MTTSNILDLLRELYEMSFEDIFTTLVDRLDHTCLYYLSRGEGRQISFNDLRGFTYIAMYSKEVLMLKIRHPTISTGSGICRCVGISVHRLLNKWGKFADTWVQKSASLTLSRSQYQLF